jgi:tetratricopeptide (TPR) repeat protein
LRSHLIYLLGRVAIDQGDLDRASRLLTESIEESRTTGCGEGTADALLDLACVARRRGERAAATSQFAESLGLDQKLGLRLVAAECLEKPGGNGPGAVAAGACHPPLRVG